MNTLNNSHFAIMREDIPCAIVRKDNPNFKEAVKQAIQEEEGGADVMGIEISEPEKYRGNYKPQTIFVTFSDGGLAQYDMYPTWEY